MRGILVNCVLSFFCCPTLKKVLDHDKIEKNEDRYREKGVQSIALTLVSKHVEKTVLCKETKLELVKGQLMGGVKIYRRWKLF
jgi:hypothetical protein